MKNRYTAFVLFLALFFFSCGEGEQPVTTPARKNNLEILTKETEQQKQNPDPKSRLAFWKKQLQYPDFAKDSVALSKINYNIAGVYYGLQELDSIKAYMQVAWELMSDQKGYDNEKVLLYSGLGNIAGMERKTHQENYYFSRAGEMLMADSSIKLLPKQKLNIFLAAAQSSAKLKQFHQAFKFNRSALALFDQLPDDYNAKFRGYSQMAICFFDTRENPDSLYNYIQKMESVYKIEPDDQKANFIADRKAAYFGKTGNADSALFYNRMRMALDIKDEQENSGHAKSIISGNLFLCYSDMARLFINSKNPDSGLFYLNKCEALAKKYPGKLDDEKIIRYRENVVRYLFASKQYANAERQQALLMQTVESFYEAENARSVAELSTIIQLQAKDKSITGLNATVASTREVLQRNRLWLAITALTASLAVVLLVLFYYIQKQRRLKNESERAKLEQRLLRTQMEPHFIFNTLSALQSFVRFDEKDKALKYLNQFGRLLRSSLELSRESLVPLNEEIETLENYLSLQKMRFDGSFDYYINMPDEQDLDSIYIPPMLVQPFVENALLHGIDPDKKNGRIDIDFVIKEHLLEVTIKDNGKGIRIDPEPGLHKSLSTSISKERLMILAKETGLPAGMVIESNGDKGTKVSIIIPFRSGKPLEK